jgi:pimeloyl-ACP methyl ester carboxylesterase
MRTVLATILALSTAPAALAQVETYAALPNIWGADLSPDGGHLATGCSPTGEHAVCVYDLSGENQTVMVPAPEGARVTDFYWPSPTHLVISAVSFEQTTRTTGLEAETIQHTISYSLETQRTVALVADAYVASSLEGQDDQIAMIQTFDIDRTGTDTGTRFSARDDFGSAVFSIDLDTGNAGRRLLTSTNSTVDYILDLTGGLVLDVRYDEDSGLYSIHRADGEMTTEIFQGTYTAQRPVVYGLTIDGQGAAIGFPRQGLQRLDITTGELSSFNPDASEAALMTPIMDRYADTIVGYAQTDNLVRQTFIDNDLASLHGELTQILSEDSVTITSWSTDRTKLVVEGRNPGQPATYYLLDLSTGGLGSLGAEMTLGQGETLSVTQAISYTASDGLEIPAFLTLPPGQTTESGPFALIVMPHGGPQSRTNAEYNWEVAYYASLGYAVLQPNFRGSDGYGTEFREAGFGGFGTRMIEDIIDGASAMREMGIARDGDYCVNGASYGGYAAMMIAVQDAEHVACAISFGGVADPFSILSDSTQDPDLINYWEQYMGSRFADAETRNAITPASRLNSLSVPLLVMHGENDTTVPFDHFRQLQRALRGQNNAQFVRLADVDHYLGSAAARTTLLNETASFLRQYLPVN